MDLRHSKATLISLGAVDTTGVPAANQVARFFDADTVQGSANFTFSGTILALTGNMTISAFLALGTTPAAAGTIRIPNAGTITMRNAGDNADIPIWSSPQSDEVDIGDTTIPTMRLNADITQVHELLVNGQINGETTRITRRTLTVATPSGASVISVGHIPVGSLVLAVTTRVTTAVTGPAGFDVGDGVDVDRWGNSLPTGLNAVSDSTDQTNSLIQMFTAANDIVITSDGVDFTGGAVQITLHYIAFAAATS